MLVARQRRGNEDFWSFAVWGWRNETLRRRVCGQRAGGRLWRDFPPVGEEKDRTVRVVFLPEFFGGGRGDLGVVEQPPLPRQILRGRKIMSALVRQKHDPRPRKRAISEVKTDFVRGEDNRARL